MPLARNPPIEVVRFLRREVGFACPVAGCASPYLTWHHFDPPWRERQHHDPKGMIALCREHHGHADAGNFTKEQLHAMKSADRPENVLSARFPWMRERFLTVVGGNFYLDTPVPVRFRDSDVVALARDDAGLLQLDVSMLSAQDQPRMVIRESMWYAAGNPSDLACPPSGKLVRAEYDNGDLLEVRFVPDLDEAGLAERYPRLSLSPWLAPDERLASVEITMRVGGTDLDFGPRTTCLPGGNLMSGNLAVRGTVGLQLGPTANASPSMAMLRHHWVANQA